MTRVKCWSNEATHLVWAFDVNLNDQVPILVLHVLEAYVSQNARIIDQDVNPAKLLDRRLYNVLTILHAVIVGDCVSTRSTDLFDNNISGLHSKITY